MLTVSVETWIGNAAAVLSGTWGAVSRRAQQSGYSRTSLYHHAQRVVQAVFNEQAGGISYETLWEANERLRAENEALWHAWCEAEALSEAQQRESPLPSQLGRLETLAPDHVTAEPHTRWECRSSPYYQNTALYPIIDLIQRTLRWQQDETPEEKLERLERQLSQYRLPVEETVPLFAPLLSLPIPEDTYPPLNLSPQRQRQKTLESIVAILLELAEQQPVLFILEDLHWTDPTTLEFLGLLVEQVPTASLYALLTCRPHFQPAWQHRSYLTEITVNRLSKDQIERMAERMAGRRSLPDEVLQQIVEKTDGVPLFVEEITKAVLESGVLKEREGHYDLAGSVSSLSIPATLQDSLMARLDRLVSAKGIAQLGAMIGRQFSFDLLQVVSQLDESTLQRELGRLVEAELVYQRGLPPQAMYTFKHALVQDIAYESLLRSTRQGYHQRIAQGLEERFPETTETQPELLAHHATEGGMHEQAVAYWYKAGQHASERLSHREALNHFHKGLEVLMTLADTPDRLQQELRLYLALGSPLMALYGYAAPELDHYHRHTQELCQRIGDPEQHYTVLGGLLSLHLVRAALPTARDLAEERLRLAQRDMSAVHRVDAHRMLGNLYVHLGEFPAARAQLEQGATLAASQLTQHAMLEVPGGQDPRTSCLTWLALALWALGYPDQARQRSEEGVVLAQQLAHPFNLGVALTQWLRLQYVCGMLHLPIAQERTVSAMREATEHGFAQLLANETSYLGMLLAQQGQLQAGITQMQQGWAAYRATGANVRQPMYLAPLAEAYGQAGQVDEGLQVLVEALAYIAQSGERWWEAELHRLKGALLLQQSPDNHPEAESCFHKALDVARHQEAKSWELRAATSLAKLWQSRNKRQEAYDLLAPVYGWFTEGFDTADLKDAKALLDELR